MIDFYYIYNIYRILIDTINKINQTNGDDESIKFDLHLIFQRIVRSFSTKITLLLKWTIIESGLNIYIFYPIVSTL